VVSDVREALLAKQREVAHLIDDLTALLDSAGDSANRSRGDRYGLSADRHSQAATLQELRRQSTGIERALAKLHDDTYGLCDACGAAIPQDRLDFRPWAVLCVPCAVGT
jgi:DnaK suppressor protein